MGGEGKETIFFIIIIFLQGKKIIKIAQNFQKKHNNRHPNHHIEIFLLNAFIVCRTEDIYSKYSYIAHKLTVFFDNTLNLMGFPDLNYVHNKIY